MVRADPTEFKYDCVDGYAVKDDLVPVVNSRVPVYKTKRPPQLHIEPYQGGSTYKHDIPHTYIDVYEHCWMDIASCVHVQIPYSDENMYENLIATESVLIHVNKSMGMKSVSNMFIACRNRKHDFVRLHGYNMQTHEHNYMGVYVWCTPENIFQEILNGRTIPIAFSRVHGPNVPSVIPQYKTLAYNNLKRVREWDCCIGCATGVKCFKL